MGDLRKRIAGLSESARKRHLLDWLDAELPAYFARRIPPVDTVVADRWGRLLASAREPMPAIDSLIAATALAHGLMRVTRNLRDFRYPELTVLNPWAV